MDKGLLRVLTDRGERQYELGTRTIPDATPPVLDWRMSPLAEAFFRAAPGEPYELEGGQEGKVLERWIVDGDRLIGDEPRLAPPHIPQPDRSALVILDPEQQKAVDLPADTSLVVDGEAGVGKTLVAMYRIASLQARADAKSKRFRALVLVPTEGLRRLCRLLADRLGLHRLEIAVVDDWLVKRAHEAFPGLPKRLSEGATAQVIALKRHPAVRAVLDDFIHWKAPKDNDEKLPRSRARLLHLWGDRDRLLRIIEASDGVLPERAIAALQKHTRIQFETTTEKQMRHVDADRLIALDGKKLDAGTPTEDVNTFDAEDVPVLFELVRRGALPEVKLPTYDHIVIDEGQLRSPLELAAIGDALARDGTVTLAGDHRQATDETAYFAGWAAARAELRTQRWEEITLAITYRSVPAIGEFARSVSERRPLIPDDPAVCATPCAGHLAQAALLCWHLDALQTRDPWRQIAVIARNPEHAKRLMNELSRGLDPVLVLDGDFRFEPGVIITTMTAVSGLEFDCVVIPDVTPAFYPLNPQLTHAMYVASTRARDWLWILSPEAWSPLVARTLDAPTTAGETAQPARDP